MVGLQVAEAPKGTRRAMKKPGSFYEYNDVRVNRLSLSLLQLFKEPLPSVLKRRIMDPIGASTGWKLGRLPQFDRHDRRQGHGLGAGRRPLGRRHRDLGAAISR